MTTVFEEKKISKAILRAGLPAMLGQLTTLIYNIADTFFVSLTKEPAMIAAVTLCTPILLIVMSVASVFGMGGNSVIARMLGEEKEDEVSRTLNFCIYGMLFAGILILAAGLLFMKPIAALSGADAENMAYTCDYLKYIFLGAPFIILSNGAVHLFRSLGLIKESTIGLALEIPSMSCLTLFLSYCGAGEPPALRWPRRSASSAPRYIICFACFRRPETEIKSSPVP